MKNKKWKKIRIFPDALGDEEYIKFIREKINKILNKDGNRRLDEFIFIEKYEVIK